MEAMPTPQLLDVPNVQQLLKMGRSKVKELIASGELRSVKIGRARRVPIDAIADYIARLEREQNAGVSR